MASRVGRALYEELSVTVPWGKMAAKCWDRGNTTKTIIGVHGWQDNANTFDRLAPLLPQDVKFIAVDLPGHGKSSYISPGSLYEIQRYVVSLHYFINALNLTQVSLLGHSLGGAVCSMYSGSFPDKIRQLILIESISAASAEPLQLVQRFADGVDALVNEKFKIARTYSTIESAIERLMSSNAGLTKHAAEILIERGITKYEDGYKFVRDPVLQLTTLRISEDILLAFLSNIKAATIIILADNGSVLKYLNDYNRPKLFGALKNASSFQQVSVPGSHYVHLTDPTSVIPHIREILAGDVKAAKL